MIKFSKTPKFGKTQKYLERLMSYDVKPLLHEMGRMGVTKLRETTPKDTGETADAWGYKIEGNKDLYKIIWTNDIVADRTPLVLMLQFGHGTRGGYFVQGRDFINPALLPVYDALFEKLGQEVSS